MKVSNIGIIGAGQMGTGIAEVCAASGFAVCLFDTDQARVDQAITAIEGDLKRLADKRGMDKQDTVSIVERVSPVVDYDGFSECQIVIEAAVENEDVKKDILRAVCQVLAPDAVLTSNTSTISITRLGAQTDRPGRFIGTHFMNPVPKISLVELIRGIATEEQTYRIVHDFVLQLGKTPVSAEDFPAFIVHRILMPMINEAIYTLYEGVGSVESIDVAMRLGTRHPMGPLELADFIGLDTCLGIMQTLHDGLADSKYRPCPLLVKYVEAGWLGLKVKRGFYDYSGQQPIPTR